MLPKSISHKCFWLFINIEKEIEVDEFQNMMHINDNYKIIHNQFIQMKSQFKTYEEF